MKALNGSTLTPVPIGDLYCDGVKYSSPKPQIIQPWVFQIKRGATILIKVSQLKNLSSTQLNKHGVFYLYVVLFLFFVVRVQKCTEQHKKLEIYMVHYGFVISDLNMKHRYV